MRGFLLVLAGLAMLFFVGVHIAATTNASWLRFLAGGAVLESMLMLVFMIPLTPYFLTRR